MVSRSNEAAIVAAWHALATVQDPELPVLSICELGIVRGVRGDGDDLVVTLTPTYSGCPATRIIEDTARNALHVAGLTQVRIDRQLAPAWTTDWLAPEARPRLAAFGIAPPGPLGACAAVAAPGMSASVAARGPVATGGRAAPAPELHIDAADLVRLRRAAIACPRCGSHRTALLARFGSTPCKALYRCADCLEPFDHFKPH